MQILKMEIIIDYLKNYPEHVPVVANWSVATWGHYNPQSSVDRAISKFEEHLNEDVLPICYIALHNHRPIAMVSLRPTDGIQPELTPWLASLYVDAAYRGSGIGETLIDTVKTKAANLGYKQLYLLAFDSTIPQWYAKLGWKSMGTDTLNNHAVSVMKIEISKHFADNRLS